MPSLVEIGAVVLGEKLSNLVNGFLQISYFLSLEMGVALNLNKLYSHKDALCQF